MYGAQTIGETPLSASSLAVSGVGGTFTEDIVEPIGVADVPSTLLQMIISFAETTAVDEMTLIAGLPVSETISAGFELSAQFLPTDLWMQVPLGELGWSPAPIGEVSWLALVPNAAGWTNQ